MAGDDEVPGARVDEHAARAALAASTTTAVRRCTYRV
jgi:hypothetical protein